jgi:hypothetical protein
MGRITEIRVIAERKAKDLREGAFAPKLPTPGEKPVTVHQLFLSLNIK